MKSHGSSPYVFLAKSLYDLLIQNGECLEWPRFAKGQLYGHMKVLDTHFTAHRFFWEIVHGRIPRGQCVMHSCDNTRCVNIAHLKLGSLADNVRDMVEKKRHIHGRRHHSARLTEQEVYACRRLHVEQGYGSRRISELIGINKSSTEKLLVGKTWKHVPMPSREYAVRWEVIR